MAAIIIRIAVNAVALWAAAVVVPGIKFPSAEKFPNGELLPLIVVALVFGLVNAYIKPIVKAISLPISLLVIGLVGFVINAAMLLLTAAISDALNLGFKIGDFPPKVDLDAIVAAVLGAIVISVVSTALTLATAPIRR